MSIGMADNGDYFRVLTANDMYSFQQQDSNDQFFGYFNKDYGIREYYNDAKAGGITTSQNIFVKAAEAIDTSVTHDFIFDIRYLAGIQILMLALGIYLFVDYLTFKKKPLASYLIAILVVFVFADLAYGAYFNSFYQEGIVYVSFMICISSALILGQKRKYNPYFLMALFAFSAFVLIFAKQQNAPLGVVLAVLCVFIALRTHLKTLKSMALIIAGALAVSGIAVYALIPQEFVDINKYHAMTRGTMLSSENPEDALSEFMINRQFTLLNGTNYYDSYPFVNLQSDALSENFFSKYSYTDIAMYYFNHPDQFSTMINYASANLYQTRPNAMGNFEKAAGYEYGEKTKFFVLFSTLKQNITPKTIGFLIVWCLGALLMGLKNRFQMMVILLSIAMGLSQVFVAIVGAGDADFAKHVFLYTLVFDYINVIGFSWMIGFIFRGNRDKLEKIPTEQIEEGYYTEYPEERRARYGERRTRSGRKTTVCLCLLLTGTLMVTGCAPEKKSVPTTRESSGTVGETIQPSEINQPDRDNEVKTYVFLQQKMAAGGGVRTNYLDQVYCADYATGDQVLSESQGLYMLYTAHKKDEAAFKQALSFTRQHLDNTFLFSYRYDPSGEHVYNMNAALDDLRIISALLTAGESFENKEYTAQAKTLAERFYNTNIKNGYLYSIYDSDYKVTNDSVTLCYIDCKTLNQLAGLDGSYKKVAENMTEILNNGMISEKFPMFYNEYSYKNSSYNAAQDINMVQSMLSALHLAQVGECPGETVAYIKSKVEAGELYGQYDASGAPQNNVQSTALYAIAALIGKAESEEMLYNESIKQMEKFRVTDKSSEVYGAYADSTTNSAYSFDNLMALLAFEAGN